MKTVQISIPCHAGVHPETLMSLMGMQAHIYAHPGKSIGGFAVKYWRDSMLPRGRFGLLTEAMKGGFSHILWIDSDMTFPKDTMNRLVEHDLPVVGANCVRRMEPYTWTAADDDLNEVSSTGKTGLETVGRLGFGVTLMEIDLFKKLTPPFFNFEWRVDDPETQKGHFEGEDYNCFRKLAELGIKPVIDHDLSQEIGHIGDVIVGATHAQAWVEGGGEG